MYYAWMKHKFIHIILITLVVFIVCSIIGMLIFDGVARSLVQSEGTKGLGTDVRVTSMHVGFFSKESNLRDLVIANPEGFLTESTPTLLAVEDIEMDFGLLSLLGSAIEIPTASISGIQLNVEQLNDVSNIETLVNNVTTSNAPQEEGVGKSFAIGTLTLKDITVTARGEFIVVNTGPVTAHIDEIILHDVGTEGGTEVAVEAITTAVTQAIMQYLAEHPVEGLSKLVVGQVTGLMNELPIIKELGLGDLTQGITDGVGKGVDDVLGEIGNLLGGDN